jgi:hypothetical protein
VSQQNLIRLAVVLTTAAWVAVVIARGSKLDISLLSSFGIVTAVVTIGVALLDRLFWRLPGVNAIFRWHSPLIRGTWEARVDSSRQPEPFLGYLVIDQRLSSISARMLMETGWSETLAGHWGRSDDGHPAIFYIWRRYPANDVNSAQTPGYIQFGAGVLEVCRGTPFRVRGPYWTSEHHGGTVTLAAHKKTICKSHEEAVALFDGD